MDRRRHPATLSLRTLVLISALALLPALVTPVPRGIAMDDAMPARELTGMVLARLGDPAFAITTAAGSGTNETVDGVGTYASFRSMGGVAIAGG